MEASIRTRPLLPPVKPRSNGAAQPPKEPDTAFLVAAITEGKPILATLKSGRCHIGKVVRFGLYTVEILTEGDGSRCGTEVEIPCRPPYRCPVCGVELVIVWRTITSKTAQSLS
jgi:DNA-directed RNA polymerase subunit RPC12/RpoP